MYVCILNSMSMLLRYTYRMLGVCMHHIYAWIIKTLVGPLRVKFIIFNARFVRIRTSMKQQVAHLLHTSLLDSNSTVALVFSFIYSLVSP